MGNAASIGKAIREDISKTVRDVMLLAVDNVINATPVDTTNAANNWILSFGRPYPGVDGSREAPSHAVQDASIRAMQNYDAGRDGKVYLRNNVLYLEFLDRGWSQQAEPGFVAAALTAAVRRAPRGRKQAARKMLIGMARKAYIKNY